MSPIPPKEHKGFFLVGKIIRTHGYKGGLKLILDVDQPEEYRELDVIFIDIKGQLIPWAIEHIHIENNKANLKLTDLHDMKGAEKMVGNFIYLPVELLPKLRGNRFYFHEVIGFTVIDEVHGQIGAIERVIELPNNPLLSIKSRQKEVLIPITDEIILKVDRRKKQIHIKAPDGLIDIYYA